MSPKQKKGFFELWGEGADWEELQAAVEAYMAAPATAAAASAALDPTTTFRVVIETFGHTLGAEQRAATLPRLDFIPFRGAVRLSGKCDHEFYLLVSDVPLNAEPNGLPPGAVPRRLYFGRRVAARSARAADCYTRYDLKARAYLGPTSMSAEMAFVMANQAHAQPGALVFDPYAGTGSILIAAAARGARVVGGDIDIRVIKLGKVGKDGVPRDVFSNFKQYGLPRPELLRMDAHAPPFRDGLTEVFDAIVGDPPYGVRAGGRKSAPVAGAVVRDVATHIARTQPYALTEVLHDLLSLAARTLRLGKLLCWVFCVLVRLGAPFFAKPKHPPNNPKTKQKGGRLVFFLPSSPETYSEAELPEHPALLLVANSEQVLTGRYSRRLLTMIKVAAYDASADAEWREARRDVVLAIERVADIVWAPSGDSSKGGGSEAGGGGGGGSSVSAPAMPKFAGKNL